MRPFAVGSLVSKSCSLLVGLCFGFLCSAQAAATTVHYLTVAANSGLGISNEEVDSIIERMNFVIAKSFYPWDVACPTVSFKRSGDVISVSDFNFLTAGTFQQLRDALYRFAPSANVMVVTSINCEGSTTARGCASIGEPLIVGQINGGGDDSPGMNPQLGNEPSTMVARTWP
jgi:hypothetical protein